MLALPVISVLAASTAAPLLCDDGLTGADYPGAKYPIGLTASPPEKADLDGDGSMDLVMAHQANGAATLSILFGRPDGTFDPQLALTTGNGGADIAIADVDGDGDLDIACSAVVTDHVTVHRNLGGRSFAAPEFLSVGRYPIAAELRDVTGDGAVDLVIACYLDSTLEVRAGDGAGGFGSPMVLSLPSRPYFVDLGDADGDGHLDALVTFSLGDEVHVRLGDGTGGFGAGLTLAMGDRVARALWRDTDIDGALDIVSVARGTGNVTVRMGAGDGTFGNRRTRSVGDDPQSVEIADLDGDGQPDFVVTRESTFGQLGGRITTVRGQAGAPTGVRRSFRSGSNPQGVAIHDLNGDGFLDLAAANGIGGDLAVLLGRGDGRFDVPEEVGVGLEPRALMSGDFNGDGAVDVVTGNHGSMNLTVLLGDGDGSFLAGTVATATGIEALGGFANDFNGDGHLDVAVSGRRNFSLETAIVFGDGTGGFSVHQRIVGLQLFEGNFDVGDVNGDGRLDLVAGNTGGFSVYLGTPSGSLGLASSTSVFGADGALTVADLNHDDALDVAMPRGATGEVRTYFGDGTGSFSTGPTFQSTAPHTAIAAGDVNGDGLMDLAYSGRSFPGDPSVEVALGDGTGAFTPTGAWPTRREAREISIADLDLDGHGEVIVSGGGVLVEVEVFQFDSTGTLSHFDGYTGGEGWGQHLTADLNGDGNLDIVAANVDSHTVTILLNRADVRLTTYCDALANSSGAPASLSNKGSRSLTAADFRITVASVPAGETVTWFSGPATGLRSLPGGTLCISGPLMRNSGPQAVGPDGTAELTVDFGALGLMSGTTWHFQCWYSDQLGAARTFNFSNALAVLVCP